MAQISGPNGLGLGRRQRSQRPHRRRRLCRLAITLRPTAWQRIIQRRRGSRTGHLLADARGNMLDLPSSTRHLGVVLRSLSGKTAETVRAVWSCQIVWHAACIVDVWLRSRFFSTSPEDVDMQMNSLEHLFVTELKDLYSAEKQLLKALPKMAKAATSRSLQN